MYWCILEASQLLRDINLNVQSAVLVKVKLKILTSYPEFLLQNKEEL